MTQIWRHSKSYANMDLTSKLDVYRAVLATGCDVGLICGQYRRPMHDPDMATFLEHAPNALLVI
jgi:hypothetical protein